MRHAYLKILLIISFPICSRVNGDPLSGVYYIGQIGSNFLTIGDAVSALELNGLSGPVTFNLLPGVYREAVTVNNINGDGSYSVTFQSSTQDSNDVIIEGPFQTADTSLIKLKGDTGIVQRTFIFQHLTLNSLNYSPPLCFYSLNCSVTIKHCLIENEISALDYILIEATAGNKFLIESTTLSGSGQFDRCDSLLLTNNSFDQEINAGAQVILTSRNYFAKPVQIEASKYCSIDSSKIKAVVTVNVPSAYIGYNSFNSSETGINNFQVTNSIFAHNTGGNFYLPFGKNDQFLSCSFKSLECFAGTNILLRNTSGIDKYNPLTLTSCTNVTIDSCYFNAEVDIEYCTNDSITNNLILPLISVLYSHKNFIYRNNFQDISILYSSITLVSSNQAHHLWLEYCDSVASILNNYFNEGLDVDYNEDSVLIYNNNIRMAPPISGIQENNNVSFNTNVYFRNNNLNKDIIGINTLLNLDYNNYYPYGGDTEKHAIFIDPQYPDTLDLTAKNPLLAGKGEDLTRLVSYDIDGYKRLIPPSIGANEICLTSSNNTTAKIKCGDRLSLNVCNYDSSYEYSWNPGTGLSDSTIPNPILTCAASTPYVCTVKQNQTIIESDTINVDVSSFQVKAYDTAIQYCGYGLYLNPTWNESAAYRWTPSMGLSDSLTRNPFANPNQTTAYIVSATIAGCPSSSDTLLLTVNPLPVAYAYIQSQNYNEVSFLNASTCADSYKWLFGDGSSDTATNPTHEYKSSGTFLVTLKAFNTFGEGTYKGYIFIDTLVTFSDNPTRLNATVSIFPNPVSAFLTVSIKNEINKNCLIEIVDELGKVISSEAFEITQDYAKKMDMSSLSGGIYILELRVGNQIYYRKFLKL